MISICLQLQILSFALVDLLISCLVFSYLLISIDWYSLIYIHWHSLIAPTLHFLICWFIFALHLLANVWSYNRLAAEMGGSILPTASAEAAGCPVVERVYRKPLSEITIELSKASKYIAVTHQLSIWFPQLPCCLVRTIVRCTVRSILSTARFANLAYRLLDHLPAVRLFTARTTCFPLPAILPIRLLVASPVSPPT